MRSGAGVFISAVLMGLSCAACGSADSTSDARAALAAGSDAAGAGGGAVVLRAGSSAAGSGAVGAAGSASVAPATFTQVYALFTMRCAGSTCHVGTSGRAADGLAMTDKATAYRNLVGVNASACFGDKRVVAGNPDKSELVHTLTRTRLGTCTQTPQMPLALPKLPQNEIDTVVGWVMAGAPNN